MFGTGISSRTYLVKSSSPSMWRGTGEYLDGVTWGGGYTGLGSIAPR